MKKVFSVFFFLPRRVSFAAGGLKNRKRNEKYRMYLHFDSHTCEPVSDGKDRTSWQVWSGKELVGWLVMLCLAMTRQDMIGIRDSSCWNVELSFDEPKYLRKFSIRIQLLAQEKALGKLFFVEVELMVLMRKLLEIPWRILEIVRRNLKTLPPQPTCLHPSHNKLTQTM